MSNIPSRKASASSSTTAEPETESPFVVAAKTEEAAKKFDLAGRYRVREGYHVAHGDLDNNGRHSLAAGGAIVMLTHDEALSVIRLTKDQKDADGRPNVAIETEESYKSRLESQRQHEEFLKALTESNAHI